MARMYRHAPLNAIWEGSGNVMALDVLRAAKHIPLFVQELKQCEKLGNTTANQYIQRLEKDLMKMLKDSVFGGSLEVQRGARNIVDRLAIAQQASLLLRYGCPKAAEMYVESRMLSNGTGDRGMNYGSTPYSAANSLHVINDNLPNK